MGNLWCASHLIDTGDGLLLLDVPAASGYPGLLINIQKSIETLLNNKNIPSSALQAMGNSIPQYSATMATVIVVVGPVIIAYPFFQKYFIKGLTVGSVKG